MKFKLSNQAVGAIMIALQKGILEERDITELLKGFEILDSADGLIVDNPPMIHVEGVGSEYERWNKDETKEKTPKKKRATKKRTTAKKKKVDA